MSTGNNPCTICGAPGIPGLVPGAGKCQYHWNVGQYGEAWANHQLPQNQRPIPDQYRPVIRAWMKASLTNREHGTRLVKTVALHPDWVDICRIVCDGPYDNDIAALREEVHIEIEREKGS